MPGPPPEQITKRCEACSILLDHSVIRRASVRRVAIILAERAVFRDTRRAEKHDGVLNFFVAEMRQRLQILGENAQPARVGAFEKCFVQIGNRAADCHCSVSSIIARFAAAASSRSRRFSNCLTVFNNLRQFRKGGDGAQPLARFESRRSGNYAARRHVAADAALRVDDGVVVNGQVSGDAHLSGQQNVLSENGAAGETSLRADDVVLADHAGVAHLHQAVDFCAALHTRFAHRWRGRSR